MRYLLLRDFITCSRCFSRLKFVSSQFLIGSAHILKQHLFRRACDVAFGECDINGKDHILKQEVYTHILLYLMLFLIWLMNSFCFWQLQDSLSLSIPYLHSDEVSLVIWSLILITESGSTDLHSLMYFIFPLISNQPLVLHTFSDTNSIYAGQRCVDFYSA